MGEILDKAAVRRRTAPEQSRRAWSQILAKLVRDPPNERVGLVPASREWRDVVADMIVGRR